MRGWSGMKKKHADTHRTTSDPNGPVPAGCVASGAATPVESFPTARLLKSESGLHSGA